MNINKVSIEDIEIREKRVFIRVDFNVPLDTNGGPLIIADDTRIRSSLPTINYAIDQGAKVILCSHHGRPAGKPEPEHTLAPIAARLGRLLKKDVLFARDCVGQAVESLAATMAPGDVLLLENVRFHPGEVNNHESFAKALAAHADVYINDAFGTAHRDHASTTGITRFVQTTAMGFLLRKEIRYLESAIVSPTRPFVAILGGAKVSGKIGVIDNLGKTVDKVIIGGGMAFTFLKALGLEIGASMIEDDMVDRAREIHQHAIERGIKFYLPVDCVVATHQDADAETKIVPIQEIPNDWIGVDIGPASARLFEEAIENAKTILWNGPMGVFEIDAFSRGTFAVAHAVGHAYAMSIVGGGDTGLAVHRAHESENISFVSTGGGAALQFLEGHSLPGLAVLPDVSP
ncbi:MAG: phosphoglycerate kinase [Nitrospiraceae bacterium]|nr:phosphoglycerate kinase [Nitrospiraceae bacterium]|tara:strand:+ start:4587 stop:5795 length:1209 start_codon:yes stop_codon:yes gene_type:complete